MPGNSLLFVLSLVLLSSFPSSRASSQTTYQEQEKQALLQIKSDWGNPPALHSWSDLAAAAPLCKWNGIQCSATGSVTGISLYNKNLTSPIPAALCNIKNLSYLDVSDNYLPGPFPTALYNCSALQYVDLSQNLFVGVIPSDVHRLSPRLTYLSLTYNNFTGDIPPSIGRLPSIQTLLLESNFFNGSFPAELGNLSTLQDLELSYNPFHLASIPPEFGNMTALTILFMIDMNLVGQIPDSIANLSQLLLLSLEGNQISGPIPPMISSLRFLTDLRLSDNKLSGEIPVVIGSMRVLNALDLSNNQLTGEIPPEIGNLKLNFLDLSNNQLTGEIPASLQNHAQNWSFLSNPSLCSTDHLFNLPTCGSRSDSSFKFSVRIRILFLILGVIFFLVAAVIGLLVTRAYRRRRKDRGRGDELAAWKLTTFYAVDFTETNIIRGLTDENLIGRGGSGMVYRVAVSNCPGEIVAVKKISNSKKLDSNLEKEFQAEVQILGSIRHANIVKLLCCISSADSKSKLLVYEYMGNGSLHQWLHMSRRSSPVSSGGSASLDWPTRLGIAVGAAQGLCYMHHGCSPPIIHRDVKSSNILLDSELGAKVADFGLARMLVKAGEPDSVSALAGTFGYIAPECAYLRKVNEKVDVYSFGVVLLELVTGREANGDVEDGCLAEWAWRRFQEGGTTADAIDEGIKDPSFFEEIEVVFKLGLICTGSLALNRPSMKEVLQVLLRCRRTLGNGDNMLRDS